MSLELMAIAVGLATFADELRGRQVWIFEDNTGAEATTQKGSSKADDHNSLVHEIWTLALMYGMGLWIDRVPSDDNLADLPSREEYKLLHKLGAVWRTPQIPDLSGMNASSYVCCGARVEHGHTTVCNARVHNQVASEQRRCV